MKLSIRVTCSGDGRYVAEVSQLPGCRCSGPSPEQARLRVREYVCGYLAAVGNFVPEKFEEELIEV